MAKLIGAMTTAQGDNFYKCGLFFSDTDVIEVRLGLDVATFAEANYETWETVVESVNANKISIVDYNVTEVPSSDEVKTTNTIPYDNIKSVTIRQAVDTGDDASYDQFDIEFSTGPLTKHVYVIPAASLDEAQELLKKTPLASKIKFA